jgi:hypothetical protein
MSIETARDRVLEVTEEVEEPRRRRAGSARSSPHDPAGVVVSDVGQVATAAPIGDLIDPNLEQDVRTGAHPDGRPPLVR